MISIARAVVEQVEEIRANMGEVVVPTIDYLNDIGAECLSEREGVWQLPDGSVLVIENDRVFAREH